MKNKKLYLVEFYLNDEEDTKDYEWIWARTPKEAEREFKKLSDVGEREIICITRCPEAVHKSALTKHVVLLEFIGDCNYWEWYDVIKNITPREAILNYLKNEIVEWKDDDEAKEILAGKIKQSDDGCYYIDSYEDIRARIIKI